ncbi:MAG TPA: CAP domain-containing protein [Pyrinomonadaceae bacterium]|nr:CAP domain-containing protein [Pyrinomonadaceae bacterium]
MKPPRLLSTLFACALLLSAAATPTKTGAQQIVNTKSSASAAAMLEQDIVSEINLVRTRPAEYAAYLEKLRPMFSGKEYRRPGLPGLMTEEGTQALDDAIAFLRAARPAPALTLSLGMCSGARELVRDQSASGATGHQGADGSFCEQRAARFGSWTDPIGENLSYGTDDARERVITLLIDDGFANRNHRKRLLDPTFKVAGVACGNHKLGSMCVITLAAGFAEGAAKTAKPGDKKTAIPAGARRF